MFRHLRQNNTLRYVSYSTIESLSIHSSVISDIWISSLGQVLRKEKKVVRKADVVTVLIEAMFLYKTATRRKGSSYFLGPCKFSQHPD